MMLHAWHGYRNYTWGENEIKPISGQPNNQGIFGGAGMGATIVDAADTLWLMGLKEEYEQARDWIRDNFDMKKKATGTLSVFETTIRFLGGLLSLNALTGEAFYVAKAKDVGDSLLKAFNTPTGIPKSQLSVQTGESQNFGWASSMSILSEIGTLHLEFAELSRITGDPVYLQKVQKVRDVLDKAQKLDGLYPNYISPTDGRFSGSHISLGALGDSFYEYLIKAWLYSNFRDDQARRMYWAVSEKIQEKMVSHSRSNLTYLVELRNGRAEHQMGHLACFAVGMFALEGHYEKEPARKARVQNLAEELGRTCHESYIRSESHIGPEMFYFIGQEDATAKQTGANGYILRPEVIEGWFYLWRLTGKQMYRDWVWDAVESMEKWCRREKGYVGLQNVYKPEQGADDVQQSFFLAETLKYAYLTFTEDTTISRLHRRVEEAKLEFGKACEREEALAEELGRQEAIYDSVNKYLHLVVKEEEDGIRADWQAQDEARLTLGGVETCPESKVPVLVTSEQAYWDPLLKWFERSLCAGEAAARGLYTDVSTKELSKLLTTALRSNVDEAFREWKDARVATLEKRGRYRELQTQSVGLTIGFYDSKEQTRAD
ncbi:unnamed protein product, partial [Mesorhabditis spiculigera]